ncbi:hypothetical protein [Isoptericola haloaureus]|uniref:Uncharacterized protein n=1 Tax=Isoptericola haloaureus TaxID=1542902 RepID=A0ABU7ZA06_9MICO
MRPLLLVLWGLLVVAVDLKIEGFDLVVDLVGWALVARGLGTLAPRGTGFAVGAWAGVLGGLASVAELVPGAVPDTTTQVLGGLVLVAQTVVVVATCTGIARVLEHDAPVARRARRVRTAEIVVTVAVSGVAAVAALASVGSALLAPADLASWGLLGGGVLVAVGLVATFAVLIWFLVLLWSVRDRPELQPATPGLSVSVPPDRTDPPTAG